MKLRVMFVKYPGEGLMPNALVVTDEYTEDEHGGIPDYFKKECADVIKNGGEGVEVRHAFVYVPDADVLKLFETPTVFAVVHPVPDA